MSKATKQDIIDVCNEKGFEYIGVKYFGKQKKYQYKCICGSISYASLGDLKRRKGCINCCRRGKKNINDIKKYFKDNGCELLSTRYEGNAQPLLYKCSCGNISNITWNHFMHGGRCKECWIKNHSGNNHYNYNKDMSEEHRQHNHLVNRTKLPKYRQWKKLVLERDNNTCVKCNADLNKVFSGVHHINNWNDYKELRFSIENGISFCQRCHQNFHSKYGNSNTNKEQVKEFLNDR